ncbi:MAG: prepilin-type N-terminal cleavage/methylation domain-containing protein [Acidobacteriota bacterium]|nr:prepilin-type N-terminal cleavage/methylation domain-containing protein [Acidobacteriota bacterium]
MNVNDKKNRPRGFSLAELLIAMTVVMIMLGFVAAGIFGVQREFRLRRPQMEAVANAQMAMDAIVRVVRMAGVKPASCASNFQIAPLTPSAPDAGGNGGAYTALRVQADWNPSDCALSGLDEDVTFSAAGGILYLDAAKQKPFVEGIGRVTFKFYDGAGQLVTNAAANAEQITFVEIEITTYAAPGSNPPTVIRSGVQIRARGER